MSILVFNAGSTSLKFGLFTDPACELLVSGSIDWAGGDRHRALLALCKAEETAAQSRTVDVPEDPAAVHCAIQALAEAASRRRAEAGGDPGRGAPCRSRRSRVLRERADRRRGEAGHRPLVRAGPVAQSAGVGGHHRGGGRTAARAASGGLRYGLLRALPPRAHVYPLPYAWYAEWGVRRFGFHGISHQYCAGRAAEILRSRSGRAADHQLPPGRRLLGSGHPRQAAVATTMGFSPLDGLMMGTRPGSLDPGIFAHVERRHGLTADDLDAALNHGSGLLGVSGVSPDFAEVELAAEQGNCRARLAVEMFADRVRAAVGALAVEHGRSRRPGLHRPRGRELAHPAGHGLPRAGMPGTATRSAAECGQSARQRHLRRRLAGADPVIHTREELMIAREAQKMSERKL